MRPIDADRLTDFWKRTDNFFEGNLHPSVEDVIKTIEDAPTVEAQKSGTWKSIRGYGNIFACSECGFIIFGREEVSDFCPNCGADMRGDTHEVD